MNIYLDHASTTYTNPRVLEAMLPYFSEKFANAESLHSPGKEAKQAIDQARKTVADILNCRSSEIIFCGSATEANNLALLGIARANKEKGKHLITSKIEHSSVLETFKHLEKEAGFEVTYIDVDKEGFIDLDQLKNSIRPDTTLVSIIFGNNEIGSIQDIKKISKICQDTFFHTDACQVAGALSLDTQNLGVDLLTINASKIYGPKGIGLLFIKKNTPISPIIHGGGQEYGLRSGTSNTPAIVGLAKALQLSQQEMPQENKRLTKLRDQLTSGLLEKIKTSFLNGPTTNRLPNNINICIPNIEGKDLLLQLDEAGIYVSTGSACTTDQEETSHVLRAIGLNEDQANASIRLTLGKKTSQQDIDQVLKILPSIVDKIR